MPNAVIGRRKVGKFAFAEEPYCDHEPLDLAGRGKQGGGEFPPQRRSQVCVAFAFSSMQ